MLCESCASGEDRRDIDIDTEVLKEIAPLAQDRRARNSHHLAIVAGIIDERLPTLHITLIPPFHKNLAQTLKLSPQKPKAPHYPHTAQPCIAHSPKKTHTHFLY